MMPNENRLTAVFHSAETDATAARERRNKRQIASAVESGSRRKTVETLPAGLANEDKLTEERIARSGSRFGFRRSARGSGVGGDFDSTPACGK
jgi:hypothetical protein